MSQPRNSERTPSRRHHTIAGVPTSGLLALLLAGCAVEQATGPGEPRPSAAVASKGGPGPGSGSAPTPPPPVVPEHDVKLQVPGPVLDALASTWSTTAAQMEKPVDAPAPLACGFRYVGVVSKRIGRSGGELVFGRSTFKVPSGALSNDTTITARITIGESIDVQFEPHGLKFAKPAEMRMNYEGCSVPSNALSVYYVNDNGLILQTMPSTDNRGNKEIRTLTDHFSGYTVAWGRQNNSY